MHASERTQHEGKIKPDVFNVHRVLNGAATRPSAAAKLLSLYSENSDKCLIFNQRTAV